MLCLKIASVNDARRRLNAYGTATSLLSGFAKLAASDDLPCPRGWADLLSAVGYDEEFRLRIEDSLRPVRVDWDAFCREIERSRQPGAPAPSIDEHVFFLDEKS